MNDVKEEIRRAGLELGFDRVGFAEAAPATTWGAYRAWLDRGDHAGMDYMARNVEARRDVRNLLPEARAAVVVAANYRAPETLPDPAADPPLGVVARYARGRDYHRVLRKELGRLARRIEEIAGRPVRQRVCVDTAPLLERDLAARAGIGWVGKHTGVLDTRLGNWFVIGALLVDLPLSDDPPARNRCGRCRACIDACPTGALREPYRLDARLCISYLTIENRGAIPRDLRAGIGLRVFGCDACLEACPWNRFAPASSVSAWIPRAERSHVDVARWLENGGARLETAMRGSALRRAGREGLLRNTAVVAGNQRRARSVPALRDLLVGDPSPLVRAHAAWALGAIGGAGAGNALRDAEAREADPTVREEIRAALRA